MSGVRAAGLAIVVTGCIGHAPPEPSGDPPVSAAGVPGPVVPASAGPWQVALGEDIVGVEGDRMFVWDRAGAGGIAERSALDGSHLRTRTIAGLNINGAPRMWRAVAGGWLAGWDAPTFIREVDGALAVGWIAAGTDWIGEAVVIGETALAVESRARAGLVHLALTDGRVLWRTPLPPWLALEAVFHDDSQVYVAMQVYDERAPTPRVAVPMRVAAFERATGRAGWTVDFPESPGGVVASRGTVVAAVGGELHFIDGASGKVTRRVAMGRPNIYPRMRVVGERVIVALHGATSAVTSFDVRSGARQWSTELPLDGGPELAALDDVVFVTTAGLSVAALDVNSGAIRWDVGVGVDGHRLYASPAAVVVASSGGAGGFALPVTGEEEEAKIRGRVVAVECGTLADAAVQVGGRAAAVAADGTFSAKVRARGVVVVRGAGASGLGRRDGGPPLRSSASVRLDGSGAYVVPDLTLSRCDSE